MKKLYAILSLLMLFDFAKAQFPAPYCSEIYKSGVEPISYVKLDSINNTTSPTTSASGSNDHEDFTSLSTTVTQALSYQITVQGNTDGIFYTDYITVFIDWNQNGDFNDAGERFDIGTITNSDGTDSVKVVGTITVPINATVGATRMRVAKHYNSYQNPCNPTGIGQYGQAEDYTLNVKAAPSCTGTPPQAMTIVPKYYCKDSLVDLSLSGLTATTGLTYQWQCLTHTSSWQNIAGATSSSSTVTLTDTCNIFRCKVTCTSTGLFSYSMADSIGVLDCSQPANDDICNAIELFKDSAKDCKNTELATSAGDPSFNCSAPNNTTWYKYTPSATGNVILKFDLPQGANPLYGWVGVYTLSGSCGGFTFTNVTNTTLGACTSFGGTGVSSDSILATLQGGTEYYFMIDGVSGASGSYCISIISTPLPPTSCATNVSPAANATNVTAPNATLKWNKVANATSYDLYLGTVNPPTTKYASNIVDTTYSLNSLIYSTDYYWYIVPNNIGGPASGCDANTTMFTTEVTPPPPANDICDSAVVVSLGNLVSGSTLLATLSQPAELCNGYTGTADDDVWFQFTTNSSGDVDVTLVPNGTSFDAVIIGYSGTCGSFTNIGCADTSFSGGTETMHLTGLNANETYYFRVYSYGSVPSAQGTFKLSVSGTALPVKFSRFSGFKQNNKNVLEWTTLTEQNNKGFNVEKSMNGKDFISFAFVESKAVNGNSNKEINYTATDNSPYNNVNYYRVKQVDKDGKYSYSKTIAINGVNNNKTIIASVYPNPSKNVLNVNMEALKADNINFVITDVTGRTITKTLNKLNKGTNNITIDVANLQSGVYFLNAIGTDNVQLNSVKFIKE